MPGSGLGLAIVKAVVERHKGDITIKESADGGTRMEVILPGKPGEGEAMVDGLEEQPNDFDNYEQKDRGAIFAERWFNQG